MLALDMVIMHLLEWKDFCTIIAGVSVLHCGAMGLSKMLPILKWYKIKKILKITILQENDDLLPASYWCTEDVCPH